MEQVLNYRGIERLIVVDTDPILLFIGYKLFVLGATGRMTLSAKSHTVTGFETLSRQISECLTGFQQTIRGSAEEPYVEFSSASVLVRLSTIATQRESWNVIRVTSR